MATNHTLISKGTKFTGEVQFSGDLHVQGDVIGNIIAEGSSELEISQTGKVEGQVNVPKVVVRGTVHGDIRASKHLELGASAIVNGNVYYSLIEMVKGAQVNGNLVHIDDEEAKKPGLGKDAKESPLKIANT